MSYADRATFGIPLLRDVVRVTLRPEFYGPPEREVFEMSDRGVTDYTVRRLANGTYEHRWGAMGDEWTRTLLWLEATARRIAAEMQVEIVDISHMQAREPGELRCDVVVEKCPHWLDYWGALSDAVGAAIDGHEDIDIRRLAWRINIAVDWATERSAR